MLRIERPAGATPALVGFDLSDRSLFDGLRWWSYHRPEWTVGMVWRAHDADGAARSPFEAGTSTSPERLTADHPALVAAADVLRRVIEA